MSLPEPIFGPNGKPVQNLAAMWVAKRKVEIREHPIPDIGPEDVLVQVVATGICGSDLHNFDASNIPHPLVLGHESSGRIVKVGSEVKDKVVGQRVAIEPGCEFCIRGNPNICLNLRYSGLAPTHGLLAQYVVCSSYMAVPIPESVSWEQSGAIQPLAVAVQLARRAGLGANQTVAIFGCGPLGCLIMALAKAYGAKKIIVFDIEKARVDFALSYAADIGVVSELNTQGQEPLSFASEAVERVVRKYGLGPGVDVAIDASGSESGIQMGVIMTKPGGTYVQAGLSRPLAAVPMFLITAKELTVKGTVRYTPGCFADAIDLLERKLVDLAPLITSVYPLSRAQEAFEAQAARKDIKIVIMNQGMKNKL